MTTSPSTPLPTDFQGAQAATSSGPDDTPNLAHDTLNSTDAPQSESEDGGVALGVSEDREFDPVRCLFCNRLSASLDTNLEHMGKTHGLFIPDRTRLGVDVETLLAYMHLIIFGYLECLCCDVERKTAEAIQHHMIGRGHCKIDILSPDSEFADFYDLDPPEEDADDEDSEGDETNDHEKPSAAPQFTQPDGQTLRLPSGKLLSHRSARTPRPRKPGAHAESEDPPTGHQLHGSVAAEPEPGREASGSATSTALSRAARREAAFASRQLATMRAADRRSLMHLPVGEQRAVLVNQRKQVEKARRAERAMHGRVETMGNKTLMMHFVNDVPGRLNG